LSFTAMLAPGLPVMVSRTWQVMKGRVDIVGLRWAVTVDNRDAAVELVGLFELEVIEVG
jgi:hypothetical protein